MSKSSNGALLGKIIKGLITGVILIGGWFIKTRKPNNNNT